MQEPIQITHITTDRILAELAKVGFAQDGDFHEAKLTVSNKIRALELLGKYLGAFDQNDPNDSVEEQGVNIIDDIGN